MKCKKIVATLMLSASVLGTITPLVPTFAEENRQEVTQQEGVVPDSALRKVLNSSLNQEENTTLTKEQLSSITEITGNYGIASGTLSSLEGLQYCTSLKKMSCAFDGTVTDFRILGTLASHVEFGLLSWIGSNLNKTVTIGKDGVITVDNPYKDVNGDVMVPTKISNDGTYDQATNKVIWKDLDVTHDYDLTVEYAQTLAGINESELSISAEINVDALASNRETIKFNDSHLAAGLIRNLNEQQIDGNASRQLTDPIYKNELQKLTKLDLSNQEIQDLSGLESCKNLQSLNLSNNSISDNSNLSKVIDLPHLAEIDLSDNQLTDVSVFCATKSLGTITVNNNKISSIDPGMLTKMSTLRHFNVSGNSLTNFDFVNNWGDQLYQQDENLWRQCSADVTNQKEPDIIAKVENNEIHVKNPLKGISKFTLSNDGIYDEKTDAFIWKNIENISSLTVSAEETNGNFKKGGAIKINIDQSQKHENVEIPDINLKNAINKELGKDLSYTPQKKDLQKITKLNAWFANITNLKGLEYCTNLEHLDLNGDKYTDLTPIANLTKMKTLNIANNKAVTDISCLKNLTNLINLYADNSNISDISVLANMTNLKSLHIPYNSIKSLNGLESCTNLEDLDLNGDKYTDLTPITNLTKMKTLNIANNKAVTDISCLKNLTNLINLYADNSNISDISVLANMTDLRSLHVPNNPITDFSVLDSLHVTDRILPKISQNLFHNSEFKLVQKENHWSISEWSVATIAIQLDGINGFKDTLMDKEPNHMIGQDFIKFEDGSDLYRVGTENCDFIGVNEKTQKVTLATSCNGVKSTCFSQAVDTKPGQKYHFSIDIESNKVTKNTIGKTEISEFSDEDFVIECRNEDGSHLVTLVPHCLKKSGNTYSVDNLPAKSNKIKFYIFLGNSHGLYNVFNSAQISHLSLTENK